MAENPPNQTIYLRNINEKIKKEELKKSLYALCAQYGQILDVVALKTVKMRGQAFVVFKDLSSATNALRQLQGFNFYDKPLEVQYAKHKSFVIAKEDGTFNDVKRKRDEEKEKEAKEPKKKKEKKEKKPDTMTSTKLLPEEAALPPNKILFIQNLPEDSNEQMLTMLFHQFPGFREVRLVPGKSDIAFVEFDAETSAAIAKDNLHNFKISPTHLIKITFAKR